MTELKNISLLTVLKINLKMKLTDLMQAGMLQQTTGNPLLAGIPVNDSTVHGMCSTLQTFYTKFKASPPTATKQQVDSKKIILIAAYNKNAAFIQSAARDAATAAGSVDAGINLVQQSGYKLKKPKSPTELRFKVEQAGPGAVDISTKAVAKYAGYIRQYGMTSAKGVPPTVFEEKLITLENYLHLSNLESAHIYAFREASIVPVGRKSKGNAPTTKVEKKATQTAINAKHKAAFVHGKETHYDWSEWVYVVIL